MRSIEPEMCNCTSRNLEIPGLVLTHHLALRFGALDDVSFTIGAGEVVAIVGPSGCEDHAVVGSGRLVAAGRGFCAIASM
jgi:ABC-type transport system involved in cytochrome bd biosynthesis fused ATPase/permease subunit